ncbi:hypothetical protein [Paenarthrobacter ureafaciens]|uniref:hypothetical protein n=1 Tax=Paenarthrobacter ureafaciens TaxID=37931 RepID=UPI001C2BA7F2|nr:hypothetical protein [Paenarthrobacter ureafaciens]UOD80485.1 hypothetical protein MQZ73_15380 [Paenarthrobacter ureafaciens]WNZ03136.1 hypothetical protein PVT25_16010 [Paenarthrobacter ureafaciens]
MSPILPPPVVPVPAQSGVEDYGVETDPPVEESSSAPAAPIPTPEPTPTKTAAAPPVASAEIAGPLKAALAPVAQNNPVVQGLTVLVLLLLGLAYFRALRSKGIRGARVHGK